MSKKQNKRQIQGSIAILRYARLSPIKARLIAREIKGMNAEVALASLEFTSNKAARAIYKTLASAIANGGYEATNVEVSSCRIDTGPVLRRFMPRARGRATPIRKPMAHIYVEVSEVKKEKKDATKNKVVKQTSKGEVK
ncbi:50S ribosomal protein L22 [Helicobacter didelphidarum]|uniref:Large ribosomal subunit protein uL22 n=1 Tax=Helicobacter didelphidarum TaxID=2040648 RepID=A0A3D8IP72_9HELI|nr:50S ribosomal protein L22 [Helicobacter didelphidarum]RDU66790.1 50S ribosomal protein L22 [Helicobacter didelphidarum]